jgi:predicted RecA/RadA family phage recombinase
MKNYISKGKQLTITAGGAIVSGSPVQVGELVGVALTNAGSGEPVVLSLSGVFECAKATGAVTQGAKLYWDDTAKNVTTTASSHKQIGHAWAAQQSGDATVLVKLMW